MALKRRIQHIRGTTAQNDLFTGKSGEITVDTETNELRVHDGSTAGGHRLYTKTEVDTLLASKTTQTDIDTSIATLLSNLYPVGSLYFGTQNTCPMAVLISGSAWELVPSSKALWTGNGTNANTTIAAGIPNIKFNSANQVAEGICGQNSWSDGAAQYSRTSAHAQGGGGTIGCGNFLFDASRSSSVYRNDVTTVQPPAYVVNVWRRTA